MVCGGAIGPNVSSMVKTNKAFVVSITPNLKEYSIIEIAPMKEAKTGHTLVFHEARKIVFAIGGMTADGNISKST